jgi:hypothetical protein
MTTTIQPDHNDSSNKFSSLFNDELKEVIDKSYDNLDEINKYLNNNSNYKNINEINDMLNIKHQNKYSPNINDVVKPSITASSKIKSNTTRDISDENKDQFLSNLSENIEKFSNAPKNIETKNIETDDNINDMIKIFDLYYDNNNIVYKGYKNIKYIEKIIPDIYNKFIDIVSSLKNDKVYKNEFDKYIIEIDNHFPKITPDGYINNITINIVNQLHGFIKPLHKIIKNMEVETSLDCNIDAKICIHNTYIDKFTYDLCVQCIKIANKIKQDVYKRSYLFIKI